MNRSFVALACAGLLGTFSVATRSIAQTPQPLVSPESDPALRNAFDAADRNHDGRLDEAEARQAGFFTRESFSGTDRDADGFVTAAEVLQAFAARVRDLLSQEATADADHDGTISREEASAGSPGLLAIFDRSDRDRDGRVSQQELVTEATAGFFSETATPPLAPNLFQKRFN